jgi:FkbM family methyltransferase
MTRFGLHKRRSSPAPPPARGSVPAGVLDCLIGVNEHGAYAIPRSSEHRPAAQATLHGEVWERETVELLRACDPSGDIVHAGTFYGDFLPALGRSRAAGAQIYAFEPNAENYRCAQITVLLNGLSNVQLTNAALHSDAGLGTLAICSPDGLALGGGSYLVEAAQDVNSERVHLTAVDAVVPDDRRVAVVQLDVEGHEEQALLGAVQTIRRCRPLLVLESPPPPTWFAEHLGGLGYSVVQTVCGNAVLSSTR